MKKVITARDVELALADRGSIDHLPADAIWTPAARDVLAEKGLTMPVGCGCKAAAGGGKFPQAATLPPGVPPVPPEPVLPCHEYTWAPGADPQTPEEIQRFFYSEPIQRQKQLMVHVGHKLWKKG